VLAALLASSVRMASQWEQAVVLRLGKFQRLAGPGLFFIIPVVDSVPYVIDRRTITTSFRAEKTLSLDTVPVDVDAVLFWRVLDTKRAALEVANYSVAVAWSAQTALRDVIGRSSLARILSERQAIDEQMRVVIDQRTMPWGIQVLSVEIRDVSIPPELQTAMSRQAQAERERQARVILAQSEVQIAEKFAEAAKEYAENPTALHLRAMNMLYEGLKERGALMIVPSSALDSMGLGSLSGLAALGMKQTEQQPPPEQQH
jgi:regulator of protease activity HflC (stomatin/prohibitin superfamily)